MKRPIVIEFSGLPNSGKTTLLGNIKEMCLINSVKATIIQEPAELLPKSIPKGITEQNLWITLETIQKSLELKYYSDIDYILLDRGFYNQLFWSTIYEEKDGEYSKYVMNLMEGFDGRYNVKPDYLYIIDVDVEESMRRRAASGEPVTFSKKDFLIKYQEKFSKFSENIANKIYLDTTGMTPKEVADDVYKKIVALQ